MSLRGSETLNHIGPVSISDANRAPPIAYKRHKGLECRPQEHMQFSFLSLKYSVWLRTAGISHRHYGATSGSGRLGFRLTSSLDWTAQRAQGK